MSNITDNPLDESSYNPNDTTSISSNPTGITSPPPFYTKRPIRISKMTRFKFLPKRKQYSNQTPLMFTPNLILNHPYHNILLSPQILMITLHHLSVVRWTLLSAYVQKLITPFLSHLLTLITLTFLLLQHSWPLFYLTSSLTTLSSQKLLSLQNFNQFSKYLSL